MSLKWEKENHGMNVQKTNLFYRSSALKPIVLPKPIELMHLSLKIQKLQFMDYLQTKTFTSVQEQTMGRRCQGDWRDDPSNGMFKVSTGPMSIPVAPAAPTITRVTGGLIGLSWNPPIDMGGADISDPPDGISDISHYRLFMRKWNEEGTEPFELIGEYDGAITSTEVGYLVANTKYEFKYEQ